MCMCRGEEAEVRLVQGGGGPREAEIGSQLPVGKVFLST